MGGRVLRRILGAAAVVVLVSIAVFALLHLVPGGPAGLAAQNPKISGEDLDRIRGNFGLDRPLPVQYLLWFRQVFLRFDFGTSYVTGRPVARMIAERLPATLELMGAALLLAVTVGGALATVAALRRGSAFDQAFSLLTTAGLSVPVFWLGLVSIYLFSLRLGLLPAGGRGALAEGPGAPGARLAYLVLPAAVLAFAWLASWSRYLRAGLVETLAEDYIRTARAKGLAERSVILKHAMRGAVLPSVTALCMQIPALFTGAVITETVFAWPGMGRLFYEGLQRQDYTRVLGIVVISSLLIVLFNALGDVLCLLLDPRTRPAESSPVPGGEPA